MLCNKNISLCHYTGQTIENLHFSIYRNTLNYFVILEVITGPIAKWYTGVIVNVVNSLDH